MTINVTKGSFKMDKTFVRNIGIRGLALAYAIGLPEPTSWPYYTGLYLADIRPHPSCQAAQAIASPKEEWKERVPLSSPKVFTVGSH
ncbi:hypothetical protein AMTR_s00002p00256220 [Amborella trichopoda]|uniref:Uncharacterized protein n=1 Tax=Amborella trichopoda TaxID=13333 RepID=W1P109_AMBTC|nr:hypothetical protein AMTR_s00002p00256220 [Amborella trichopoda]